MSAASGAGAGAGSILRTTLGTCILFFDDSAVLEALRAKLSEFMGSSSPKATLALTLQVSKGPNCETKTGYLTKLQVEKTADGGLSLSNDCVSVQIAPDGESGTKIAAKGCFDPELLSNSEAVENRITRTDVLQVLKTKLVLAHPFYTPDAYFLIDTATVGNVEITPFRLLRGKLPFYRKYGYSNPFTEVLYAKLPSVSVSAIVSEPVDAAELYPSLADEDRTYGEILGIHGNSTALLVDVLKGVSLEEDGRVFGQGAPSLSAVLLNTLLVKTLESEFERPPDIENMDLNLYTFNPESFEWQYWKQRIVVTEFALEEARTGGGRKRKSRKSRKQRRRGRGKTKRV